MADYSLGVAELGTAVNMDGLNQGMSEAHQAAGDGASAVGGAFSTALGIGLAAAGGMVLNQVGNIFGAIQAGVASNMQFETFEVQFGVLLKSTDLAKQRIEELTQFAASTPFDLPGVVQADKVLQGFGLHSEESAAKFGFSGEQIRTISGDVAAGTGQDFTAIAGYIGKFASGATGEAISRFQELGIVTREELTGMGVEFDKSGALTSPLPEAMNTVLKAMQDKFGGMMDKQSQTLDGMISNFDDWKESVLRTMAAPLFEVAKEQLGAFLKFTSEHADEINSALTTIGTVIADVLGAAISFVADTVIPTFIAGWQMIAPVVETVSAVLESVGAIFTNLGNEALVWGENIVNQLTAGMLNASSGVVETLNSIGSVITEWLIPHSPPKLLPELTNWGSGAMNAYMEGWNQGDFTVFNGISSAIENSLKQITSAAGGKNTNIAEMMMGSQGAITEAINEIKSVGSYSEDTFKKIVDSAGDAGPQISGIARAYLDLERTTQDVSDAQEALNQVTEEYSERLTPLQANLRAIQDQKQAIKDQERLVELQKTLADGKATENEKALAQLEIQEIQAKQQIKGITDERDAAVGAAKDKLEVAKEAQASAKAQVDQQNQLIKVNEHQNDLIAEQTKAMESAAKAMGGAAAAIAAKAKTTDDANKADEDSNEITKVVTQQLDELGSTVTSTTAPAIQALSGVFDDLGSMIATIVQAAIPVFIGLGNLISATFTSIVSAIQNNSALILSTLDNAWNTVLDVVTSVTVAVLGVVKSWLDVMVEFVQQNGEQIMADIISAWSQIQEAVNTTVSIVADIVVSVLGVVQTFIQQHGADIQAFMMQAWTQISGIIQVAIQLYNAIVPPVLTFISNAIQQHGAEIQQFLSAAWEIIKAVIDGALTIIKGVLTAALQIIQGDWAGAWETVKTMVARVWEDIKIVFSSAWEAIKAIFTAALGNIISMMTEKAREFVTIGKNIVDGIKEGLSNAWESLKDLAMQKAKDLFEAAKSVFDIGSPSKLFRDGIGIPLMQGIQAGIIAATPEVISQLETLGDMMLEPLEAAQKMAQDIFTDILNAGASNARLAVNNFDQITAASDAAQDKVVENGKKVEAAALALQAVMAKSPTADMTVADQNKVADAQQNLIDVQSKYTTQMANTADSLDLLHEKLGNVQQGTTEYDAILNQIAAKERAMVDLREKQAQAIQDAQDKIDELEAASAAKHDEAVAKAQKALDDAQKALTESQTAAATAVQIASYASDELSKAEAEATEISKTNAQAGADYLKMRSSQIFELANLEKQRIEAEANGNMVTAEHLQTRIDLVKKAQVAEVLLFQQHASETINKNQATLDELLKQWQKYSEDVTGHDTDIMGALIWNIQSNMPKLSSAMQDVVKTIITELQTGLGINSPSTVASNLLGGPISEGIAAGISAKAGVVNDAVSKTASSALNIVSSTINESLNITANYKYQDERTMRDDITMMTMLRGSR